jgi:hypothetical protein
MKLISVDENYSGYVTEVCGYGKDAGGATFVSVVLVAPDAWYSGIVPVTVNAKSLRTVAAA